jgi:hypothetical protein
MSPPNNDNKNVFEQATGAVQSGLEQVQGFVHDATKPKEKTFGEKISDAVPGSAKEAGTTIGDKVDQGVGGAQDMMNKAKKDAKN